MLRAEARQADKAMLSQTRGGPSAVQAGAANGNEGGSSAEMEDPAQFLHPFKQELAIFKRKFLGIGSLIHIIKARQSCNP